MAHLKKLVASKHFPIAKKINKFTITPAAGPHGKSNCIPLGVVVRDSLKLTEKGREAKKAIVAGEFLVDGRPRRSIKYPVGLMDVLQIPKTKKNYRMIAREGKLKLVEIDAAKAKHKLCKIVGKTVIKGGKFQINLHDGRNIIVSKDEYKTGDTLVLSVPDQKVEQHFKLEKGASVIVTGGKYVGAVGTVDELIDVKGIESNKAVVASGKEKHQTLKDYVFVIGKDKPEITLE